MGNHEEAAFEALYDRYFYVVYKTAYRLLNSEKRAEDLAQDVFVTLWEKRHKYAHTEIDDVRAYIRGISRNRAIDAIKKSVREQQVKERPQGRTQDGEDTTTQYLNQVEMEMIFHETMTLLPEPRKQIYQMAYDGVSHKDIAERFNLSLNAVRLHMVAANKLIRSRIRAHPFFRAEVRKIQ